ncbi:patj-like, partial [Tropilaelaps mercedesae]
TADSSEVLRRLSRQLQRGHPVHKDIQLLLTVLDDPLLRTVLQIKVLVHKHPSILPRDFDIARDGTLDYRCDTEEPNQNGQSNNPLVPTSSNGSAIMGSQQVGRRLSGGRQHPQQLHQHQSSHQHHPSQGDVIHGQQLGLSSGTHSGLQSFSGVILDEGISGERFLAVELIAAPLTAVGDGQQQIPGIGGLGLTVVPLAGDDGETHFYIKHIHPDGVAHRDGRLSEGDKVVAINGTRLSGLSHRDVVQLLQQHSNNNDSSASEQNHSSGSLQQGGGSDALGGSVAKPTANLVSLLVDTSQPLLSHQRQLQHLQHLHQGLGQHLGPLDSELNSCWTSDGVAAGAARELQQSGEFLPEMVLNTEWAQVEAIELVNDGSGLGFGIIGGRSTGVVVKTILPGGVADRDGRLLSGDHILQIGDVNLRGMGSEQVAAVLRQAGTSVRLVVARAVDASVAAGLEGLAAPVVPTRILADADQIERHLAMFSNNNNSVDDNSTTTTATVVAATASSGAGGTTSGSAAPAGAASLNPLAGTSPGTAGVDQASVTPAQANPASGESATGGGLSSGATGLGGVVRGGLGGSLGALSLASSETGGGANTATLPLGKHSPLSQESSQSGGKLNQEENVVVSQDMHAELLSLMGLDQLQLPEMETFEVELVKDQQGLGITIAGYVCEKGKDGEISGVFVKSVAKGSAADLNGRIRVNDQVIEVDGRPLQGYTNHQAVELLRSTGKVVKLRLARYLRGARYDQLQQAIMAETIHTGAGQHGGGSAQQHLVSPVQAVQSQSTTPAAAISAVSPTSLQQQQQQQQASSTNANSLGASQFLPSSASSSGANAGVSCATLPATMTPIQTATNAAANPLISSRASGGNAAAYTPSSSVALANLDNLIHGTHHLPSGLPQLGSSASSQESEQEKIDKWTAVFGADDYTIVVAQLCKFHEGGGLGISLEGTVDVNEAGEEVRPHHYIRSVLPDGPVGLNGVLRSGDELIEVNGRQLLGLDHRDVVTTLKDLPLNVEMVCARPKKPLPASVMSCSPTPTTASTVGLHGDPGHHQASKAKSDTSLNRYSSEDEESGGGCPMGYVSSSASGYAGMGNSGGCIGGAGNNKLNKLRSRSLEPLSGLAMWSNEPQLIELHKAERGLGFSILDYQDPMNPNETVIVIRSLVPGGVAQQDGRLIPGDRLLFVNDVNLENASLDAAVQALKGAAKGPVRIGVAKPLPLPCPHDNNGTNGTNGASGSAGVGQVPTGESGSLAALVKSESF